MCCLLLLGGYVTNIPEITQRIGSKKKNEGKGTIGGCRCWVGGTKNEIDCVVHICFLMTSMSCVLKSNDKCNSD